jgi:glycine/D-amino acid oxidase-like deaminating enzyme
MTRRAVVVGAGVLGAWTALELLERGWSVEVFDRCEPGTPSRADARILRYSHGPDLWQTRSAVRGIHGWHELRRRTGCDFLEERGVLLLVSDRNPGDWERHSRAALRGLGVPVQELDAAATRRRFPHINPDGLAFAVWEPTAGVIRAEAALRALHGLLAAHGSEGRRADCRPGPAERVLVEGTPLAADAVVWAVGAHAGQLFPGRVPIRAARQDSYRLSAGAAADTHPAWLDTGAELYGVPGTPDRTTKAVLDLETTGLETTGDAPGGLPARLHDYLGRRFPGTDRTVRHRETCAYAATDDDLPMLGRVPGTTTHWLIGGDGGAGFKHAPAWAGRLADVLDGLRPPPPRLSLDRHALKGTA